MKRKLPEDNLSSEDDQSSIDTSEEISATTSTIEVEYTIDHSKTFNAEEIQILLEKSKLLKDVSILKESVIDVYQLRSDDLVLGCVMVLNYSKVHGTMPKNVKKKISANIKNTDDLLVLNILSICNTPLDKILDLYKSISFGNQKILIFSRLVKIEKHEREDVFSTYPEFDRSDLEYLPYYAEEIFLLKVCKERILLEVNGTAFRLFIVDKDQFKRYLNMIEKELNLS